MSSSSSFRKVQPLPWQVPAFLGSSILCMANYLELPFFRQYYYRLEPAIWIVLSIFCILSISYGSRIRPGRRVLVLLLFFLFELVRSLPFPVAASQALAPIFLALSIFVILGSIFRSCKRVACSYILYYKLLILSIIIAISCTTKNMDAVFWPNKSIMSIVIAALLAFIFPFILDKNKGRIFKIGLAILFAIGCILLIGTEGRAGWIGLLLSCISVIVLVSRKEFRRLLIIFFLLAGVGLLFFLVSFKQGSSDGRMLIWKISLQICKDHPFLGIGAGRFRPVFNEYQADWFVHHSINSSEALLAGDTSFAFSEPLQLLAEEGVLGLALLVLLFVPAVRVLVKSLAAHQKDRLWQSPLASCLAILSAALWSYPFHSFPLLLLFVTNAALLSSWIEYPATRMPAPENRLTRLPWVLTSTLLILLIHFSIQFNYRLRVHNGLALHRSGFQRQAMAQYHKPCNWYCREESDLLQYARLLYETNELEEAEDMVLNARQLGITVESCKLLASIYKETGRFSEAEASLLQAIHLQPCLLQSRLNLMEFHLCRGNKSQAFFWANSILSLPIKIPSSTVSKIRAKAAEEWKGNTTTEGRLQMRKVHPD